MRFFNVLHQGILLKRYKRFLADVQLADGRIVTAHCPNTGSMRTCSSPGSEAYLSESANLHRKYPYTLELIKENGILVGVNTSLTNAIVEEAFANGRITELGKPTKIQREVRTSTHCRLDFALHFESSIAFVEVKSCTFAQNGIAMFPDAVTKRGHKHLLELANLVKQGYSGIVFFLVQRQDVRQFCPAASIDPLYSTTLQQVHEQGVTILVYQAAITPEEIVVRQPLPFHSSNPPILCQL